VPTASLSDVRDRWWYHTIELPDGSVTPGWFDLRPYVARYGLPDDLSGLRALDVGTWDGFWAFELERRGAEVVALDLDDERDLDWPPRRRPAQWPEARRGDGFRLLHELLDSRVERRNLSIYQATPEQLGTFDLVFCGAVLLHLRDQLLALERIAGLTRPGGMFVSAEEYDRPTSLLPWPVARYHADRDKAVVFWLPSLRTWRRMLWTAGFDRVERHDRFTVRATNGLKVPHVVHHAHRGG
jgi:tRNA (mo5U34)-methyltransferase